MVNSLLCDEIVTLGHFRCLTRSRMVMGDIAHAPTRPPT
jgi:hypothetical protein